MKILWRQFIFIVIRWLFWEFCLLVCHFCVDDYLCAFIFHPFFLSTIIIFFFVIISYGGTASRLRAMYQEVLYLTYCFIIIWLIRSFQDLFPTSIKWDFLCSRLSPYLCRGVASLIELINNVVSTVIEVLITTLPCHVITLWNYVCVG